MQSRLLDAVTRARAEYREAKYVFNRYLDFIEARTIEERYLFQRGLDRAYGFYCRRMWAKKDAYIKAKRACFECQPVPLEDAPQETAQEEAPEEASDPWG